MKTFFELSKQLVEAKDEFKPHKMYDPKTGEAHDADTEADHLKYKKMGYTHEKPEVKEGFSPKEIKMAIGIASDPRYKGGNMTGAVRAIDKIKRGLSGHKQVMAVLKRQNEDIEEAMSPKEKAAHDKAIADFKKRGGKVKKLKPGYAQGWTGKDDLGTGQKGMLNKSDTSKFGTKKRVKSMRASMAYEEVGTLEELTAAEKKLVDQMYDKKGNLTPMGKKVMNHGKKLGDKGYVESINLGEKVYSKPAKLDPAIAKDPKVRAAQKAHAKGDWDGNVDKEGNAVVHVKGKPHIVTVQMESVNEATLSIKYGYDEGDGPDNKKLVNFLKKKSGATVKLGKNETLIIQGTDEQIHKALQIHYSDDKKGLGDLEYHKKGKTSSPDHQKGQFTYKESMNEGTNMYTDDRVGFQIDRFSMGKDKGVGFQINYGKGIGKGKYIQVPMDDMKRVIAQMTKAMKAKI